MEVFILQIPDVSAAVKVASYALETTGECQDVEKRVDEILLNVNSCGNCPQHSVLTEQLPVCRTSCFSCFVLFVSNMFMSFNHGFQTIVLV